jgi:hypothetical protein
VCEGYGGEAREKGNGIKYKFSPLDWKEEGIKKKK